MPLPPPACAARALGRQRERGDRPHKRVEPIGTAARRKPVGAEIAHLVFERRKGADMSARAPCS